MDGARSRVLGGFVEGIVSVFLFFPSGWSVSKLPFLCGSLINNVCSTVNRDDFISRWRNTNYPRSEVLPRVTG